MTERLEALPGATKVTFSNLALLEGSRVRSSVYLRNAFNAPPDANGDIEQSGVTYYLHTGETFWETMEIPLLAGRTFTKQDDARAPKVAVVNQSFAREFFPNESPIGKRFTFDSKKPDEYEIVGLVKTLFGLLAQQLASIGLFGVLAYAVSQRTREIGIRLALDAAQTDVLKMIIKQGMTLAVIGVALGLGVAYALTKYLESWMQLSKMLYGVKPTDPMTYGVTAVLLTLVALLACYLPARRAMKVDPMVALRCE